jgi:hypothetical protein
MQGAAQSPPRARIITAARRIWNHKALSLEPAVQQRRYRSAIMLPLRT